jgi:hypothetical protein
LKTNDWQDVIKCASEAAPSAAAAEANAFSSFSKWHIQALVDASKAVQKRFKK